MVGGGRYRWLTGLLMVGMVAAAGFYGYNLGVARGVMESARAIGAGGGAPAGVMWPRPWGYGFGFFPFFPFLFVLFWLFAVRPLFWHRGWHRRGWDSGYGGVPPAFEEWHRRAHAQSAPTPAPESKA